MSNKITITDIARVAHTTNKAYCQAIGDNSQQEWDNAPEWQRESIINGVLFHLGHPDAGPGASHESWLKEKRADGWTWGKVKDPEGKIHPCLVPFLRLPLEQQAKDVLFAGVVDAMKGLL